jgi:hypothetical protein
MIYSVKQAAAADECLTDEVNWFREDERRGGEDWALRWFDLLHDRRWLFEAGDEAGQST